MKLKIKESNDETIIYRQQEKRKKIEDILKGLKGKEQQSKGVYSEKDYCQNKSKKTSKKQNKTKQKRKQNSNR